MTEEEKKKLFEQYFNQAPPIDAVIEDFDGCDLNEIVKEYREFVNSKFDIDSIKKAICGKYFKLTNGNTVRIIKFPELIDTIVINGHVFANQGTMISGYEFIHEDHGDGHPRFISLKGTVYMRPQTFPLEIFLTKMDVIEETDEKTFNEIAALCDDVYKRMGDFGFTTSKDASTDASANKKTDNE